jgi:hypothetical protein
MKKVGNMASNKIYNPEGKKPPVPIDADEADSAMERFIRSKYANNTANSSRRQNTGSTESDETPPPLPPKTPGRFGFRSASSIFPLSSKAKREAAARPPPSPRGDSRDGAGSPRRSKTSTFGASVQADNIEQRAAKLAQLREMGFTDDQRNAIVLKGVNGNLERAVEALVRLGGGGGGRSPLSLTSPRDSSLSATRSLTPATTVSGLSVPPTQRSTTPSNNPFDMLDRPQPPPPLSSQSTGTLQTKNPYNTSNPFGIPAPQPAASFDQAFQNLSLTAPSQPLFPHHTGGMPAPQPFQQPFQQGFYSQPTTAPVPTPTPNLTAMGFNSSQTYPQVLQPQATGYNPFLSAASPQPQPQPAVLSVNTMGLGGFGSNPFTKSPTRIASPTPLSQIPEQAQQNNFYGQASQPQPQASPWAAPTQPQLFGTSTMQPTAQAGNPFLSQPAAVPQPTFDLPVQQQHQSVFGQTQQAPQTFVPQRQDKAAIMALYGMPQLAPQVQPVQQQQQQPQLDPVSAIFGGGPVQEVTPTQSQAAAGSKNPFLTSSPAKSGVFAGGRSRDSMMALGMEWGGNGRHSPDAFASLSARH